MLTVTLLKKWLLENVIGYGIEKFLDKCGSAFNSKGKTIDEQFIYCIESALIKFSQKHNFEYNIDNEKTFFKNLFEQGKFLSNETLIDILKTTVYLEFNEDTLSEWLDLIDRTISEEKLTILKDYIFVKNNRCQNLLDDNQEILEDRKEIHISYNINNSSIKGCLELGFQQLEAGEKEKAVFFFQAAINLNPNYSIPYLGLWVASKDDNKEFYYRKYNTLFCEEDKELETQYIKLAKDSIYKFLISFILCKDSLRLKKGLAINTNIDINKEFKIETNEITTLLCFAVKIESLEIVSLVLDAGADINLVCGNGIHCALEIACSKKNSNLVKYLINKGADINKVLVHEEWGYTTPFVSCVYYNYVNGIEIFLKQGASANTIYGVNNYHILGLALQLKNKDICTLLFDYGADINAFSGKYPCFIEAFLSNDYSNMVTYAQAHNAKFQISWHQNGEIYDVVRICLEQKKLDRIALVKNDEGMRASIKRNYERWCKLEKSCSSIESKIVNGCNIIALILAAIILFTTIKNIPHIPFICVILLIIGAIIWALCGAFYVSYKLTDMLDVTSERIARTKYNMFYGSICETINEIDKLLRK